MPGTPDMYKHLNNEETKKPENTGDSLVNKRKILYIVFVAVRLVTQLKILVLIVHLHITLFQHYIVSSMHD